MVLKMNSKEVRGLCVNKQIYELQSQMAMVERVLEKLGKVTSLDDRTSYCHSMLPTNQMMSSPRTNQSEHLMGIEFLSYSHEEEVEDYSNLFHDEQVISQFSDQFDPNSPPMFDSYEQEDELHEAEPPIYDDYLLDLDDLNSGGLLPSGFYADHEAMTASNGMNQANTQLNLANHDPPMFLGSFFAPNSHSSSSKGSRQSRSNSFKNCYMFKREGPHSVLIFMEKAIFKPRVLIDPAIGDVAFEMFTPCIAQTKSAHIMLIAPASKVPWVYGEGLLDFYIEDDELKYVEEIMMTSSNISGLKHQDLRSNLQQPGVFDAGASSQCKSQEASSKREIIS